MVTMCSSCPHANQLGQNGLMQMGAGAPGPHNYAQQYLDRQQTWNNWTSSSTTTATSGGLGGTVWNNWVGNLTTTSSATTTNVWGSWTAGTGSATTTSGYYGNNGVHVWSDWSQTQELALRQRQQASQYQQQQRLREEQLARQNQAALAHQQELARAEARRREAAQVKASKKALKLLKENLTKDQQETMKRHGWFVVVGGKTGKRYRIVTRGGASGNIEELGGDNDNERVVARLCVHAGYQEAIPAGDHFLAQALWLRWCEEDTLKRANRTPTYYQEAA